VVSYWISIHDAVGAIPSVESFEDGGTYAIGGSAEARLNVTYNYSGHFDFRSLHGRATTETIPEMETAVTKLGTHRHADYWQPTPGNAGAAVARLLAWARQHPGCRWEVH